MPNWNGLVLTKKGQLLQAKVGTGVVLALTKMKLGSGVLPKGTSLEDLTDLVTPEQNVGIASKKVLTDQKMCKISATITNVGLSAGYYVRELGVFANDPDDGEILYAVTADSAPDYLPPEGGPTTVSQEFAVYISASNASGVKVSIDPGTLATMGYVETAIADHNSLATAHENRFKLFEKISDFADDLIKKLALTTAITAITALETNSWFGQLLKMVLTASGVKYNIAQNGYVCFGSFLGGLIIQWGLIINRNNKEESISLPLAYSNKQVFFTAIDWGAPNKAYGVGNLSTTSFTVVAPYSPFSIYFVSVGA